jgi:hypothetical protein
MSSKSQKIILWDEECRDTVQRVLSALKFDGKPWQVVIKRFYESPSERQRGYYWSVMLPALCRHVEESGFGHYTAEQMHEWLKKKFGQSARVEIDGEAYDVVAFTTSNSGDIAAMSTYITAILQWAAGELGLYIPPPTEKWERRARVVGVGRMYV